MAWSPKDPDSVLDYLVDWSKWLAEGDNIVSSSWVDVSPDLTIENQTHDSVSKVTIWLSGGIAGSVYLLTNRIVTALGRTQDQTIKLKCKER